MIRRSQLVVSLHLFALALLFVTSILSYFIQVSHPTFFRNIYFPIFGGLIVLTFIGWLPYFGGCVLTTWENRLRAKENANPYTDSFIFHYLKAVGLTVNKSVITWVLVALMLFPIFVWLFVR